jgi:hypothetical protein
VSAPMTAAVSPHPQAMLPRAGAWAVLIVVSGEVGLPVLGVFPPGTPGAIRLPLPLPLVLLLPLPLVPAVAAAVAVGALVPAVQWLRARARRAGRRPDGVDRGESVVDVAERPGRGGARCR